MTNNQSAVNYALPHVEGYRARLARRFPDLSEQFRRLPAEIDMSIMSYAGDPRARQLEWLMDDLMPLGETTLLYGPSNVGKSFLALEFACAIAFKGVWRGRQTKTGGVFYIHGEGLHGHRTKALLAKLGIEGGPELTISEDFAPNLTIPYDQARLLSYLEALHGPDSPHPLRLLVVDTLSLAMSGADENKSEVVSGVFRFLRDNVCKAFRASVLVVHHTPRVGDNPRGSYAIECNVSNILSLMEGGDIDLKKCRDGRRNVHIGNLHVIPDGNGGAYMTTGGDASFAPMPELSTITQDEPEGACGTDAHGEAEDALEESVGKWDAVYAEVGEDRAAFMSHSKVLELPNQAARRNVWHRRNAKAR